MFNISSNVSTKHMITRDQFCQCTWWCKNITLAETGRDQSESNYMKRISLCYLLEYQYIKIGLDF